MSYVMETCRSCGKELVWATHVDTHKPAPLELDPLGMWVIDTVTDTGDGRTSRLYRQAGLFDNDRTRWTSHFATCPQAAGWRNVGGDS